ncbi:MAG: hypothetical protein R3D44_03430 [Hyphomicrobiaceae bacterium]
MTPSLVIHIGLRKTGSSALQEILARERATLAGKKIDYPERLTPHPAHQEIAWTLMENGPDYTRLEISRKDVYDHYCALIRRNAESGVSTLLSSEDLSLLTLDFAALEYMKARFSGFKPLVVFYARPPISHHISNYKHAVLVGRETRSFADYVFRSELLLHADPGLHRGVWSSLFRRCGQVRQLAYAGADFAGRSIYADFMAKVFGVQLEDGYKAYRSNVSAPNEVIQYALGLNRSDLPDAHIAGIKQGLNALPATTGEEAFLKAHLSVDEQRLLRRIYGLA